MRLPHDLQSPVLRCARLEADGLEGDAQLDHEAVVEGASLRLPDVVLRQVHRLQRAAGNTRSGRHFGAHAVGLHAEGINREHEGAAAIEERVEMQRDPVVAGNAVALGERGAHGPRRRKGADAHIQGLRCVPHPHLDGVLRRAPVYRAVRREIRKQARSLPGRLVEHPVDGDGVVEARGAHVDAARAAGKHVRRDGRSGRRGARWRGGTGTTDALQQGKQDREHRPRLMDTPPPCAVERSDVNRAGLSPRATPRPAAATAYRAASSPLRNPEGLL